MKALASALFAISFVAATHAADDPVLFRAAFDGSAAATLHSQPLAAAEAENAVFDEGALVTGADTVLEYDLGKGLPGTAGSLEVRFRPGFAQRPEGGRRVAFSLTGADGAHLDFEFEPQATCWRFATQFPDWKRQVSAPYFTAEHEQRWSHLVLTWDEKSKPAPVLRLYRDGKWVRSQTEAYRQSFAALRRLVIGGAAPVALDEIAIYREALDEGDVARLNEGFGKAMSRATTRPR